MKLLWSAKNNAFIPAEMVDEYKVAGWAIDDLVEAPEDILPFYGKAPIGKIRGVSDGGIPIWVDIPAATEEELIAGANAEKSRLKAIADSEIEWRQDAVDDRSASDKEITALAFWRKYRVALMRIDTSKEPDIEWPASPE
ncbi:tail fiber assembly protein [Yersinia enterocolitica]|uniref:tail fiber assembly protein n=4 Tax=Yersinia enterocolitica TaxID=630 RepID=UPI0027F23325|nr:tail fiber assembly protein [Yersinia enterocolitica]EKN3571982.1 tail fiber assembly protein [Yersinia enterocolitica]EKN3880792.1 tail fiber assembly protein [Yersinia enterocolitica]EKN4011569.1 tail fiber assembly protein [Yersinia enterocolitica]EKN4720240.1 tail fiber assembly protein [Yersinia enterocolitica]